MSLRSPYALQVKYTLGYCMTHDRIFRDGIERCIDCCRDVTIAVEERKPSFRDLVRIEMEKTHE